MPVTNNLNVVYGFFFSMDVMHSTHFPSKYSSEYQKNVVPFLQQYGNIPESVQIIFYQLWDEAVEQTSTEESLSIVISLEQLMIKALKIYENRLSNLSELNFDNFRRYISLKFCSLLSSLKQRDVSQLDIIERIEVILEIVDRLLKFLDSETSFKGDIAKCRNSKDEIISLKAEAEKIIKKLRKNEEELRIIKSELNEVISNLDTQILKKSREI